MGQRKESGSPWERFGPLCEKKGRVTALQIAICDDEPAMLEYLDALVNQWGESRGEPVNAQCFPSAQALWFTWEESPRFDVLLLDIQMQGLDGVSLAHKIREKDSRSVIIFITGTVEFAAEGYDVSALHYLLKPVDEEKLFFCLDRAVAQLRRAPKQLLLPVAGVQTRFSAEDIFYERPLRIRYVSIPARGKRRRRSASARWSRRWLTSRSSAATARISSICGISAGLIRRSYRWMTGRSSRSAGGCMRR